MAAFSVSASCMTLLYRRLASWQTTIYMPNFMGNYALYVHLVSWLNILYRHSASSMTIF